jgi:hypothetical protein
MSASRLYNGPVLWRLFSSADLPSRAEQYRRVHERWLTRAMASTRPIPRIPVRPVERGGFDRLLALPNGRALAERWWTLAITLADADD